MREFESQLRNPTVINLISGCYPESDNEVIKTLAVALQRYRASHPGKRVITFTLNIDAEMADKLIQEARLQP